MILWMIKGPAFAIFLVASLVAVSYALSVLRDVVEMWRWSHSTNLLKELAISALVFIMFVSIAVLLLGLALFMLSADAEGLRWLMFMS